ncbi:hypothetical protein K9M41_04095 [Candidatus Gracilibacteria bacterium]|nr:hypothetical protein [Candidatus Gracilibacteria bacterium]
MIDSTPVRIFEVGTSHVNNSGSSNFVEALLLDTLTFQMFANNGLATDPTKFDLSVNSQEFMHDNGQIETLEEDFQFDSNGQVTLKFGNARMSKGDGLKFGIDLKIHNPETTPNIPGSFQIRLLDAKAVKEVAQTQVSTSFLGETISKTVAFNPTPQTSGTPIFSGQTRQEIYGKAVSSGEDVVALALRFEAHYDDMLIQEVTVENAYGSDIDSFARRIQVIDQETSYVLGETGFSAGQARFRFSPPVRVDREDERSLVFKVQLSERVNHESQDTRFKLEVPPENVIVYGYGSGQEVPEERKNFAVDTQTFIAVQVGGNMAIGPSESQPQGFSANESLERVYSFKVTNPEAKDFSLGRLSMDIRLSGLDFSGGRSADDFELKQIIGGREIDGTRFVPSLGAGNTVIFNADNPLLVNRRSEAEFFLRMKIADIPSGGSDTDSVSVLFLQDTSRQVGALSTMQAGNANIIWSDHSARPHSISSTDWLSGYLLSGLETNSKVLYRRGY